MKILERFLKYVSFDTQSDSESSTCPSTKKQLKLAQYLVEELLAIGVDEAVLDENGYVMATLKSNTNKEVPTVGFIAHMDTSDAMSGKDIKPRVVKYTGEDIVLNEALNIKLSSKEFTNLDLYKGQDLVVTDGTTLLGADDKAGIAEIVSAIEYLVKNPNIKHGDIKIAFTPDEEIGRGADLFDVERFGADFAYTMDGGVLGELQYENFNAAGAKIQINGRSVHPGDAKDKMVNAVLIATEIANQFPKAETPSHTEGYEGFYHLSSIKGSEEIATMSYIIREFDKNKFEIMKNTVKDIVLEFNKKYGDNTVVLTLEDQYYNMKEKLQDHMYIIDIAKKAMEDLDIEPKIIPIRGGTDGSKLSYMGLLTPNIFAGGHNFHGKFEYIPVPSMEKATDVIVQIIKNIAE